VVEGIDDLLSKHISHLFIRDPVVVFTETIDQDDSASTDHFEVTSWRALPCPQFSQLLFCLRVEYTIDQLADPPIQTSATKLFHWMESGIQEYGSSNDGLRKCCFRGLRCFTLSGNPQL
jgi:hypothetical protein